MVMDKSAQHSVISMLTMLHKSTVQSAKSMFFLLLKRVSPKEYNNALWKSRPMLAGAHQSAWSVEVQLHLRMRNDKQCSSPLMLVHLLARQHASPGISRYSFRARDHSPVLHSHASRRARPSQELSGSQWTGAVAHIQTVLSATEWSQSSILIWWHRLHLSELLRRDTTY